MKVRVFLTPSFSSPFFIKYNVRKLKTKTVTSLDAEMKNTATPFSKPSTGIEGASLNI